MPEDRMLRVRPAVMYGATQRFSTGHGNTYITVNVDDAGSPFEVFAVVGKAGGCNAAHLEAITRMVSLALRLGAGPELIVKQLKGITCCPSWDNGIQILSTADAVAYALERYAKIGEAQDIQIGKGHA